MTPREVLRKLRRYQDSCDGTAIGIYKDAADAIESLLAFTDIINALPNCNDCASKNCQFAPGLSKTIRYNCPIHVTRAKKDQLEKSDQNNGRACTVDGKEAIFHRWAEQESAIISMNYVLKAEQREQALRLYKETKVLPDGATTEKFKNTFGIVEFKDGTVAEVEPGLIKFMYGY